MMEKLKIRRFISYTLCTIGIVFATLSCKSNKFTTLNTEGTVVNKNDAEIVEDILTQELHYNTISAKASIEFRPSNSASGMKTNCYLKLIKDKDLQLSIRIPFLNTEAFRLNISPDSIYIIDRMNKRYAEESIESYQRRTNIDLNFYNLQSILTNSLFLPGKRNLSKEDYKEYKIALVDGLFYLETKDKSNTKYSFSTNAKDRIESILMYNKAYNFNIEWRYSNFIQDGKSNIYPTSIQTNITVNNNTPKLNISYSSLDIDTDIDIDRQMPNKYKKSSISEILKSYLK